VIGILALQGAFIEHKYILDNLSVESFEIRKLSDLNKKMSGVILPGGESTTIGKLLLDLNMFIPLQDKIKNGLPSFGTCAGAILLAKYVEDGTPSLATMDIKIKRNAYGRQLGSFFTKDKFDDEIIPMSFIRAPLITEVVAGNILATVNDDIVAVKQNNQLVTTFHPELKTDFVHKYFLNTIVQR